MSVNPRPPLLRVLAENRAVWLAVPAIALLAGLVYVGGSAVKVSTPVTASETSAVAPAPSQPPAGLTGNQRQEVEKIVKLETPDGLTTDQKEEVEKIVKDGSPSSFTSEQKGAIETIIKNYLISNPEIFLEAQTALEAKMEKEQAEKLKVAIAENAREIYRDPVADVAGNPQGDITVVEFFDYNCGYCKRGLRDVIKLVETDPKVRVVFKELPILSKGSEEASRVAIAAGRQGKYWEMHRAMLEAKGVMNEANALQIATKLGLDIDKLKKDMASPEVESEIKKSEALAKKMGVNGTPHFLVGDRAIPGAPEDLYDQLEKHVTELRKAGCSYC
ncbi:DsbA family protein [Hyphomicrobium sp.]|uniref:DsbA family protein n=1 Tax=Hyphomicrobium sp. TaxID=82 RepID=UPI001325BA03|nr:DsbA family protein [Hyphomicrobium sp.]KAB2940660.1 MAG: DsbA family protein [Hyphomicrobium sp.]